MIKEIVQVSINGSEQKELVPFIDEVEMEEHIDSANVFRVRISLSLRKDGTWTHVDEDDFKVWNPVSIVAGYPNDTARLIDGYITHVNLNLGSGKDDSYLEITGMDASALMDLEERQEAWPNKKDSEIATAIFDRYRLAAVVEDTLRVHEEAVSTRVQSGTDIRFLRTLAARNGFECFVQGSTGYFRAPNLMDPAQRVLALRFGDETNLVSVQIAVDGTPPTVLESRRIDPREKVVRSETLRELPRRKLGKRPLQELRRPPLRSYRLWKQRSAAPAEEMRGELVTGYEPAGQFVTLSGEIDSRAYRSVLRAKRLVTIKGLGQSYSGFYYVTRVRHHFTVEGYTQSFEAVRNAVGPTGEETFTSPPGLLPAALGHAALGLPRGDT